MARLRSLGFSLASVGVVLSALVHGAALFTIVPRDVVSALFAGAAALVLPLVVAARAQRPGVGGPSLRELVKDAPPWAERAIQLAFLYVLVQFGALLYVARSAPGGGLAPPGVEARVFSAFAMLLFLICALAWWRRAPGLARGRSDRRV